MNLSIEVKADVSGFYCQVSQSATALGFPPSGEV